MLEIANSKIVEKEWHSCWAAWEFEIVISGVTIPDGGATGVQTGINGYPALGPICTGTCRSKFDISNCICAEWTWLRVCFSSSHKRVVLGTRKFRNCFRIPNSKFTKSNPSISIKSTFTPHGICCNFVPSCINSCRRVIYSSSPICTHC